MQCSSFQPEGGVLIFVPLAMLLLTLASGILVVPLSSDAQRPVQVHRIGVLVGGAPDPERVRDQEAFRQSLHDLGWVEGQNLTIEVRWAEGRYERLPDLAAELAQLQVQVIVAGNVAAARAARQATGRIPIVIAGGDAVGTGLIPNIARPDGNITGLAMNTAELSGKWLELLKEVVPTISRVATLSHPDAPITGPALQEIHVMAPALGVQLQALSVREPSELEGAFAAMRTEHAEALVVLPSALLYVHRARVIELAARSRLPTIWEVRQAVADGGLMAYGLDTASLWRRAATYVDKILKGAQPGNLPVERPTAFRLIINLITAKALGITIPPSLLLLADEVIR
jgi:putative tryptophan/tyrosine transport system substrate-binding protein